MSSSNILMLRKAAQNVAKTPFFAQRWTSITSLERAVKSRYKLSSFNLTKTNINNQLSKLEPSIDDLSYQHSSGIYRVLAKQYLAKI